MRHARSNIARLREKLDPHHPAIAMASHNPLSAKLAAEAGFDAIWGSGFELSAAYALPDASILSADTHLELMRAIGDVQDAPVIADLDTCYGDAVNVAYLVPRYAAEGVAAVTIEDKTFPKDSSLRPGGRQVLVSIEEFQGKIKAARLPDGPLVVARTEALIAGLSERDRAAIQAQVDRVKQVKDGNDVQAIKQALSDLQAAAQAMAQHVHQQPSGDGAGGAQGGGGGKDDVIDAEFEVKK